MLLIHLISFLGDALLAYLLQKTYASYFSAMMWGKLCKMFVVMTSVS